MTIGLGRSLRLALLLANRGVALARRQVELHHLAHDGAGRQADVHGHLALALASRPEEGEVILPCLALVRVQPDAGLSLHMSQGHVVTLRALLNSGVTVSAYFGSTRPQA